MTERDMAAAMQRGFSDGLKPRTMAEVRVVPMPNRDATVVRLGEATVTVTGLDVMQAEDLYALGYAKARELTGRART